jgi:hypothetical protein
MLLISWAEFSFLCLQFGAATKFNHGGKNKEQSKRQKEMGAGKKHIVEDQMLDARCHIAPHIKMR